MKVTIVKYLNPKGKVVEMRKDNFKGRDLPENIIEEYEVEIKGEDLAWYGDLKIKYATGNYILLWKGGRDVFGTPKWQICYDFGLYQFYDFKLIHNKHKDILEAYLKNPSVEIETGMFAPMTGETEPSKWIDLEKDFIEDYNEEFWYRLKVKDLAWYEDKSNFPLILTDISNNDMYLETYPLNEGTKILIKTNNLRPATESEVLSLVYKPQQKVSKENTLNESNRLRDLFLDDKAECLVENEQEFRLIFDFLDKTCDKSLDRRIIADGNFKYSAYNDEFPIILSTPRKWGNLYGWNKLEDRNFSKPLIKFDGEVFWEVSELKVLEILETLKKYIDDENTIGNLKNTHYDIINYVNEAIQELEQLNSQCCDNCIYFSNIPTPSKDGYCTNIQNGTYDLEYDTETPFDVNKDFCCNKWKRNNNV